MAAKNIDTREHDIADSDDYFQYHGGMVATVRALTGHRPKAYVGDSTTPDAVRTRSLTEETARVFRARVVNPRWISAMQRHGYKGAFELAATVDYLFGFDATAGVVTDWMYAQLADSYVLDKQNQDFMKHANPWALRGIIEKLHEAADRGLWAEPDPDLMAAMQQVYLDVEGDLEDDRLMRPRPVPCSPKRRIRLPDRASPGHLDHPAPGRRAARRAGRFHLRAADPDRPSDHQSGDSVKARNAARPGAVACALPVDGARWITLSAVRCGWTPVPKRSPTRYADTPSATGQPRENPKRVVLIMTVTSVSASVRLG